MGNEEWCVCVFFQYISFLRQKDATIKGEMSQVKEIQGNGKSYSWYSDVTEEFVRAVLYYTGRWLILQFGMGERSWVQ